MVEVTHGDSQFWGSPEFPHMFPAVSWCFSCFVSSGCLGQRAQEPPPPTSPRCQVGHRRGRSPGAGASATLWRVWTLSARGGWRRAMWWTTFLQFFWHLNRKKHLKTVSRRGPPFRSSPNQWGLWWITVLQIKSSNQVSNHIQQSVCYLCAVISMGYPQSHHGFQY